jgi:CRP-like cAMP-binding protein
LPIQIDDVSDDEIEDYGPDEIVFTQGEDADHMYLVLEGEVELRTGGEHVETVREGELMGVLSLLDGLPRNAMATSVGDLRLLPINRRRFEEMVSRKPDFGREILLTMTRRLRKLNFAAAGAVTGPIRPSDPTSRVLLAMKGQAPFPAGATIFEQGAPGDRMFIVSEGIVELRVGGKPVQTLQTGDFFGEMALLEDAPRSASAHAVSDCRLMPVDRKKFDYLLTRTPSFALEMMRIIANRLRKMNKPK